MDNQPLPYPKKCYVKMKEYKVIKSKKTKYRHKNCDFCLKDWYDGTDYITKTCIWHEKYSYESKVKKIKGDERKRKMQWVWIGVMMLVAFSAFGSLIANWKLSIWARVIAGIVLFFIQCLLSWSAFSLDRHYKWLIEEEKKGLKDFERVNE